MLSLFTFSVYQRHLGISTKFIVCLQFVYLEFIIACYSIDNGGSTENMNGGRDMVKTYTDKELHKLLREIFTNKRRKKRK